MYLYGFGAKTADRGVSGRLTRFQAMEGAMAYRTIAGFEQAAPGTYERGKRERQRQDELVRAAGGMVNYVQGARPRINKPLTATHNCDIMAQDISAIGSGGDD